MVVGLVRWRELLVISIAFMARAACALDVVLPTANDALLQPGQEARFFQPTIEGTVESGMFGCVRRGGRKFHEGIDIQCLERDRRGESIDPVLAAAVGRVVFINTVPGRSNYGRYLILEHRWDNVAVVTLYAHLREIADGVRIGQWVNKGQRIATLGRSTNTREGITPDRAHLHFEVGFMINPQFQRWYARRDPKAPPFGNYNGQNFIGLDPAAFLRAYRAKPDVKFGDYVANHALAFTVLVPANRFPWAALHPEQVVDLAGRTNQSNDTAFGTAAAVPLQNEIAAYEVGVTGWGLPVRIWPRSQAEIGGRRLPMLNRVNQTVLAAQGCRKLVQQRGKTWMFTEDGKTWLELLTYVP